MVGSFTADLIDCITPTLALVISLILPFETWLSSPINGTEITIIDELKVRKYSSSIRHIFVSNRSLTISPDNYERPTDIVYGPLVKALTELVKSMLVLRGLWCSF